MSCHDLPRSWASKTLSDIADVVQGQSPPGSTYNADGNGVPFFQGKAEFGPIHPIAAKWCREPTKIAEPGDVLISVRAPVGPTNLADVRCCIGRGLAAIRLSGELPSRFLLYYLRHTDSLLARQATGSTFQSITGTQLRSHPVVVPPRAEQHRIVSAIESYFTRLDDAVATLERVQRNLKRYRASVLKAAVEGRLVPTEAELARAEGRSYEAASVLLTRILAERRRRWEESELAKMTAKGKAPKDDKWKAKYVEPVAPDTSELPELREGWCWVRAEQCASSQVGHAFKSRDFIKDGVRLLRGDNIGHGELRWEAERRMCIQPAALSEHPHLHLESNDIVLAMDRPLISTGLKIASVSPTDLPSLLVQRVIRLRPVVHRAFFLLNLNSDAFRQHLSIEARGGGVPHISEGQIKNFVFPLPPLAEQERISREVERLMSNVHDSVTSIDASVRRCSRLRQSILKWAFEGRLVDQDPTDEPASVLLERMRGERASATATPLRRARRAHGRAPRS